MSCPSKLTRHLSLLDSFWFGPITRLFIGTSRSHPLMQFGQQTLPQPSDAMRGKPLAFPPAINGVLGYTQVLGNVFASNPRFNAHVDGTLPVFLKVVENRFKSISRVPTKPPSAAESRGSSAKTALAGQSFVFTSNPSKPSQPISAACRRITAINARSLGMSDLQVAAR